jgi:cytochrome d ubiquinol oxidase subunit II
MLANVVLVIIWVGVSAYGIFGGADFGGGMWDLVAGDAAKGARPRALIERVIGPVWEANHVWLIFVLVYLWTAFPEPFAAIASTLWIPLSLAAAGIVVRGSGFAFRKWAVTTAGARRFGAAFAGASVITPFFLGAVAGGVASGRVPLGNAAGDPWSSWLNPTSLLGGILAVLACAFLAAVLLTGEAKQRDDAAMVEYFRVRALLSGLAAGAVALVGIGVLRSDAPGLYAGLTAWGGMLMMVLSGAGGLAALLLVARRQFIAARLAAVTATVAVLWGWGVGEYPDILPGAATVSETAAADGVLWTMIGAFVTAGLVAVPALVYLLRLTESGSLGEDRPVRSDSTQALLDAMTAPPER